MVNYQHARAEDLPRAQTVIIQQESLHKLATAAPYDVVYVDEVESFLNQCAAYGTHGKNLHANMRSMVGLLRSATTVVLVDALVTKKTINFLKAMRVEQYRVVACPSFNPARRTV
eukprot:scaffold525140_cov14-Prasinocladus_malaysianus.AAC.1